MTYAQLDVKETGNGGKSYYFPVVLKVTGVSKYNANQISFEGVPDFWQLPKDSPVPPPGTIALFHLATKPKVGANAKPGSLYRDIVAIEKASEDEKLAYQPVPVAPQVAHTEPEAPDAQMSAPAASPANPWAAKDASILKQVGFKAAVELLTAKMTAAKSGWDPFGEKEWKQLADDVWLSYGLLMQGKNPEPFEPFEDPADSPLVRAAKVMGATVIDDPADLPWDEGEAK